MRAFAALALVALLWSLPASGQGFAARQCYPFAGASEQVLREKYNERVIGAGITGGGWLTEFWENTETETWSITVRSPDGLLCMLALGKGWRTFAEPKPQDTAL